MGKNNNFGYGTMTNVDVSQIEKSLKLLKETFKDEHINLLEIGIDSGKTAKAIHNKLPELDITNYTYWAIDKNPKTRLPFKECNMIIGSSEEIFNQLPSLHWVFIDGCHCSNHIMLDFLNYGYKVVKNGFLSFHDTGPYSQGHHYQKHGPNEPDFYISAEKAFKKLDIFNRKDWKHVSSDYDNNNKEWGGVSIFKKIKKSKPIVSYYGKGGQDRWVVKKLKNKENGYFVDLGASGGIKNNNTYALEKHLNWKGICVEPNPKLRAFEALEINRNCICENLCIYSSSGIVDFVARGRKIETSGIYGKCSSVMINDLVEKRGHPITKVPSITLMELLEKHNSPHIIDYINIDTEGSEYEILKHFNFDKYTFLTMTIEHNYWEGTNWDKKEKKKRNKIRKLLLSKGYKIDNKLPWEDWFVHGSIKE
jgi:FkbM family methyltransferase